MRILAIDTTASPVSVALLKDGFLEGEFFLNIKTAYSQTLMPLVENILRLTGISAEDVDLFAVNAGPGSFTGVRIGVSSVKGMTFASDKPCAAVSTLEAMAYSMPYRNGIVCAVMDARCSQVYNALFRLDEGNVERITEDRALSIDELKNELEYYEEDQIYLTGDGADICFKSFGDSLPSLVLTPMNIRYQHAYGTAMAAMRMADENKLCTSDELMPIYLRIPQAERELQAKKRNNDGNANC